jgi:hypothetical protein
MFWQSRGIVRFLGLGITFLGKFVAPHVPVVSPFSEGIVELGIAIASIGTVNAVLK